MITGKLKFISIDIETRNLTNEQVEFECRFLKHAANTKDPAKQEAQIAAKKDALKTRGALSNSAEIACIGLFTIGIDPIVLHTLACKDRFDHGFTQELYGSEESMLHDFASILDTMCDDKTVIVVANKEFDLPKLRYAFAIRNKMQLPDILKPYAPNEVYDVLHVASKYFMIGSQPYQLSLDELSSRLGISNGKIISGAEVPGMIDRGEHEAVILYNHLDAVITGQAYLILTGQSNLLRFK
jgi:hypothetical protein